MQNIVQIGETVCNITIYQFFNMAAIRHIDLWDKVWDDPQREFDGLLSLCKIWLQSHLSF